MSSFRHWRETQLTSDGVANVQMKLKVSSWFSNCPRENGQCRVSENATIVGLTTTSWD